MPVVFITSDEDSATMSAYGLGGAGVSNVDPPLEPGAYEVVCTWGEQRTRKQVTVKPGEATLVELVLSVDR